MVSGSGSEEKSVFFELFMNVAIHGALSLAAKVGSCVWPNTGISKIFLGSTVVASCSRCAIYNAPPRTVFFGTGRSATINLAGLRRKKEKAVSRIPSLSPPERASQCRTRGTPAAEEQIFDLVSANAQQSRDTATVSFVPVLWHHTRIKDADRDRKPKLHKYFAQSYCVDSGVRRLG